MTSRLRLLIAAIVLLLCIEGLFLVHEVRNLIVPSYLLASLPTDQPIADVAVSPDMQYIIAAGDGANEHQSHLYIWRFHNQQLLTKIPFEQSISALRVSPNGKHLAVLTNEDMLSLLDLTHPEEITHTLSFQVCDTQDFQYYYRIRMAFDPYSNDLTIICRDGTLVRSEYRDGTILRTTPIPSVRDAVSLAYSTNQPVLGILTLSNQIEFVHSRTTVLLSTLPLQEPSLVGSILAFCPDGTVLATESQRRVQHWSLEEPQLLARDELERYTTFQAISPDCSHIAASFFEILPNVSFGEDHRIEIRSRYEPQQTPFLLHGHEDDIRSVVFSPDNRFVISGSQDGTVRIWDLEKERS